MMRRKILRTSSALAVISLLVCLLAGCGKEEKGGNAGASVSPASYMHDKEFMKKVANQDVVRREIMKRYSAVRAEYERLKESAPEKAKEFKAKLEKLEEEFQANRKLTQAIVRERLSVKPAEKQK